MKKIIVISITGFIICTAFNKPKVLLTDYRDAYVGNYFCNRICNRIRNAPATVADTVTIYMTKDPLDSILKITTGLNTVQLKLKNNILLPYPAGVPSGGKFFAADSIAFDTPAGLGNSCSYRGKKK